MLSPPNALQLGTQTQQINSYSSVRQYVTIPPGTTATLQFWTWTWAQPNPGADRQEAILLAPDNSVLAVLWRTETSEQVWRQVAINLSAYAGRSVAIYFNVYNDGAGGLTSMFLDNVQLLACGASGPPPGPVTVLPPITVGTPTVLPELPMLRDRAADRGDSVPCGPIADIARDFQPRRRRAQPGAGDVARRARVVAPAFTDPETARHAHAVPNSFADPATTAARPDLGRESRPKFRPRRGRGSLAWQSSVCSFSCLSGSCGPASAGIAINRHRHRSRASLWCDTRDGGQSVA